MLTNTPNWKQRIAIFSLSIFLAISPLLPYAFGRLYNALLLNKVQKQVYAIPTFSDIPSSVIFTTEKVPGFTENYWIWKIQYKTSTRRNEVVSFYKDTLLQLGWHFQVHGGGQYSGPAEDEYTYNGLTLLMPETDFRETSTAVVTATISYRYQTQFDYMEFPWNN